MAKVQNTNLHLSDCRLSEANLDCRVAVVGPSHLGGALMHPAGFLLQAFQLSYFSTMLKSRDLEDRETRLLALLLTVCDLGKVPLPLNTH